LKKNLRIIQQIRKFHPTISIALEGCSASAWISYLSGAKRRIGLSNRKFSFLFTETIPLRSDVHRLDNYFDLIKKIELAANPPLISLTAPSQDHSFVEQKLSQAGISSEKPLICIHTGAGKPGKQWPMGNFMVLVDALTKKNNYQVVLVGSKTERAQTDLITKHCSQKLHNFSGELSINQLVALFKRTTLMISNDSGPMHMAALSGTPVIALFAPTDNTIWGPLSEKAIVLTGDTACSLACREKHANDPKNRCFCSITVEKVMGAVERQLETV
jgi:heptosyltransferase-1